MDNEYNKELVHYCKSCLSLGIKTAVPGLDLDYCNDCGSTDTDQTDIETWKSMYRERYGFDYLDQ